MIHPVIIIGCVGIVLISIVYAESWSQEVPKWREIHKILGCKGCENADERYIYRNGCCTYVGAKQDPETGKCVGRNR